jgi:hypothetical protein
MKKPLKTYEKTFIVPQYDLNKKITKKRKAKQVYFDECRGN